MVRGNNIGNSLATAYPQWAAQDAQTKKYSFDPANAGKGAVSYIGSELGLDLYNKRETALALAMADPSKWVTSRQALLKPIQERVAAEYAIQLKKYETAGFPIEEGMKRAANYANMLLQKELEDLELEHPGSGTIWASAAHKMSDRNFQFAGAMGGAESPVNEKEIYKRMRAKKKAKKAKRAVKSGQ